MGSIPTLGMVRFCSLGNFIYLNLPLYTQLQISINIGPSRQGTCDGLAFCPGESVQLHSKLLALNEARIKHWPSLAFMATQGILSGG